MTTSESLYESEPGVDPARIAGLKHRRVSVIGLPSSNAVVPARTTSSMSMPASTTAEPSYGDFIGEPATGASRRLDGRLAASCEDAS